MTTRIKLFVLVGTLCILVTGCSKSEPIDISNRNRLFNSHWKFVRDSIVGAEAIMYDDSQWLTVDLPHDFSLMDLSGEDTEEQIGPFTKHSPGGNHTGHVLGGTGWYRKAFMVDENDRGKTFTLQFDGVYMESEVWVNGKQIGIHKNGYTPFVFDITSALHQPGEKNVVAVKVDNIGKNSRWYSGSGIYRNVRLLVTAPLHIPAWGVYITTPTVSADAAKVNMKAIILNNDSTDATSQITVQIYDKKGEIVFRTEEEIRVKALSDYSLEKQLTVTSPFLWSIDDPNLYKAEIILKRSGKIVDAYHQPFGIRTIEFTAEKGFLLNNKPVLLKGGCMHHDNGFLGAAAIERAEYRRVELMKKNGYNAIRCSHNPPSEAFLNACDELGVLVINEFTDMWDLYKNPNDYSRFFNEWWEKDLTDMLLRDRNHPSIIMWSIGNEIPKMNIEEGVRIATMLKNKITQLDATRAITEGIPNFLIHGGWKNTKEYFALLDVCGYNYMESVYASDHQEYPDRIMYGSESFPNQAYEYWKAVEQHPYVIGDFVWTAMDYIGEVSIANSKYVKEKNTQYLQTRDGIPEGTNPTLIFDMMAKFSTSTWPEYLSWCGDLDIIGEKTPQGIYRDILWDRSVIEMNVHEPIPDGYVEDISLWGWPKEWPSWNWEGQEGKPLQVRVFTKAPQVKLQLNGQIVGEKTLVEADKYIATFDVPYQVGKLEAIALKDGKEIGRKELVTTGEVHSIRLIADRYVINPDRNDLAFIKIEAIDKDGLVVPISTMKVEISVAGCGELVASGNADPAGIRSANRPILELYRGEAQAIVRPFEKQGIITVSVKANNMEASKLQIQVGETPQTAHFNNFTYSGNDERFNKVIDPNNQYFNPILAGFYPDPSICRKGDTYYLATSTFSFYPGIPIFTSKDLVNWTQIGHALNRDSQISLHGLDVSDGLFAPSLRYNEKNETFYMLTMNMGKRSVFYVKSKDPAKGWSDPIRLKAGGMDSSFFFDKDGKAYLVYCTLPIGGQKYSGEMAIHMNEFCVSGDSVIGNRVELIRGGTHIEREPQWIEGPHLYHIGEYYYLMCAEGGTRSQHSEVIFRSKNLTGPWEEFEDNPILTQRDLVDPHRPDIVTSTGHADLIQTPEGNWWAVFLGCRPYENDLYNTGRDTYLLPVKWQNDWPIILEAGKAVPSVVDKKGLKPSKSTLTGNFSYTDKFDGNSLGGQWIFLRNPLSAFYSFNGSGITLKTLPVNLMQKESPSAIFHRQQHTVFSAETEVVFVPQTTKDFAGMVLFQNEAYNFVFGKTLLNGKFTVILSRTEESTKIVGSATLPENQAGMSLKLKIAGNGRFYSFLYATADGEWQTLASNVDASNLSTDRAGGFTGNMIGLYTTSNSIEL